MSDPVEYLELAIQAAIYRKESILLPVDTAQALLDLLRNPPQESLPPGRPGSNPMPTFPKPAAPANPPPIVTMLTPDEVEKRFTKPGYIGIWKKAKGAR